LGSIQLPMQLRKKIRLIGTFYRSFVLVSMAITACCLVLFREYGFGIFAALFWLKTATLAITYYFINSYKKKEYYYYQNLGISKGLLWSVILTFDFVLFIFLVVQLYKFK
jgi:hypothetical protein